MTKVPNYDPAATRIRSSYELEGYGTGKVVSVVAPGPSLDQFPKDEIANTISIGVNSTVEILSTDFWFFQEAVLLKKYHHIYTTNWVSRIVTTPTRCEWLSQICPPGKEIYFYNSRDISVLRMSKDRGVGTPFWKMPKEAFLPGLCSISANAMSLACLMKARVVLLLGIDLAFTPEKYYADGVKKNPGPRLKAKALGASKAWMNLAARKGVWSSVPGQRVITTSPTLKLRGIEKVSIAEAIREIHA